jgi:hypothetical protein
MGQKLERQSASPISNESGAASASVNSNPSTEFTPSGSLSGTARERVSNGSNNNNNDNSGSNSYLSNLSDFYNMFIQSPLNRVGGSNSATSNVGDLDSDTSTDEDDDDDAPPITRNNIAHSFPLFFGLRGKNEFWQLYKLEIFFFF